MRSFYSGANRGVTLFPIPYAASRLRTVLAISPPAVLRATRKSYSDWRFSHSLRRYVEVGSQAQRRVRGNGAGPVYNAVNPIGRNMQIAREAIDADAEWLHKLFDQNLARMDGIEKV